MTLVLADTSVWVDHFRQGNASLADQLVRKRVRMHPLVISELAMGNLPDRTRTLERLVGMHQSERARDDEVMHIVERDRWHGLGLGWTDAHLLAATLLSADLKLWTRDKRLNAVAQRYGRSAELLH